MQSHHFLYNATCITLEFSQYNQSDTQATTNIRSKGHSKVMSYKNSLITPYYYQHPKSGQIGYCNVTNINNFTNKVK